MSVYADLIADAATTAAELSAKLENLAAGLSVEGNPGLFPQLEARLDSLCRPGEKPSFDVKRDRFGAGGWKTRWGVSVVLPGEWPDVPVALGAGDTPDAALDALIPELARVRAEALAADRSFEEFTRVG